jgi:tetraacyldisaccharide-1-P 4'-kinase
VGATAILTTEKDRVRMGALAGSLSASLPLHAVPLRVEIENQNAAIEWLMKRVAAPQA